MKKYLSGLLFACIVQGATSCNNATGDSAANSNQPDSTRFKGQTLNILCWEGYADPLFTKAFEDKYGVKVAGTYFGSSDELVSKLQNGGTSSYDIVSPSSDVASYLVDAGLVQPIDTAKLTAYKDLSPALLALNDVVRDGKNYGLPFCWGPDYLIYDADVIKTPPTSWNVFLDPQYKGKISLWDDISNIYLAGQIMGVDKTDKSAIYNMTDAQLDAAKQMLIKMKPQVRKYWATAGELNSLFKNKEIVLAVGWPLTPANLNKEGMKLKAVIPQEGATGWIDRLMITKDSKHKELAMLYLNYISQPENMAKVAAVTNYSVANAGAVQFMPEDLKEVAHADEYFSKLNMWQYVKNRKRYNELWNEVKNAQ